MNAYQARRKDGSPWTPRYIISLEPDECIGCGRCYKACPADVLDLQEIEDEDGESQLRMQIANDSACIGCEACARACGKHCFEHAPISA